MSRRRSSHFFDGFRPGAGKTFADIYAAYGAVPDNKPVDIPQDMLWWDDDRIDSTVDRAYVMSHLRSGEARRLDQQVEFGDGLTDDTYMEWIETKAKRIFLILVDIGVPDQIFGVVDDSWDDDDLPIPLDQVERLQLTARRDQRLEKKFFQRQFTYLLRHLRPGENIIYQDVEIVPLEVAERRQIPGSATPTPSNAERVCLPGRPNDVLCQRRIPLGDAPGQLPMVEFLSGIEKLKARYHRHMVSLWGSYIHRSYGYLLLTPVHDMTLKTVLGTLPPSLKIMAKEDRRTLLMNWIHCLTDAVASLHTEGIAHGNIKPSNVLLDNDNRIFLVDCGLFAMKQTKQFDQETFDYAAPERPRPCQTPTAHNFSSIPYPYGVISPPSSSSLRRPSLASPASPAASPALSFATLPPSSPRMPPLGSPLTPSFSKTFMSRNQIPPSPPSSPPPPLDPLKTDIYSLGCIYLEILTILLKRQSKAFVQHRSAKNKTGGRGGLPNSSFQDNPAQVESWTFSLLKDAKKREDRIYRGISHLLNLTTRMLSPNPVNRPSAKYCEERTYEILTKISGLPKTHCGGNHAVWQPPKLNLKAMQAECSALLSPSRGAGLMAPLMEAASGSGTRSRSGSQLGQQTIRSMGSASVAGSRSGSNHSQSGGAVMRSPNRKGGTKTRAWKAPVYAEFSFG